MNHRHRPSEEGCGKDTSRTTPELCIRLRREARAVAAVSHPNLAAIFGAELWQGTPMLVLEYLDGELSPASQE